VKCDVAKEVLSVSAAWQSATQRKHNAPANESRHALELSPLAINEVSFITREQLVAAVARKRHRDMLARHLRDDISRYARHIGERLVVMPDYLFDYVAHVRSDDELVMLRVEVTRGDARIIEFIEAGFGETNRK